MQNIKTNQAGKGNKPKSVKALEITMSIANILIIATMVLSSIFSKEVDVIFEIVGISLCALGILFFLLATITMKTSWRVGIPEEKTSLITNGVYTISRNPAFVGFDLLYAGACFMFPNIYLIIVAVFAAITLHIQIIQEEKHMFNVFGDEYKEYKKKVFRYLGRKF